MTSIMTEPGVDAGDGWGAARADAKVVRSRKRRLTLGLTAAAVLAGIPFIDGFVDGFRGVPRHPTPDWIIDVLLLPVLLLAAVVSWRNWREMDEVQRALAVQVWAVIGCAGLVSSVLLEVLGKYVALGEVSHMAWFLSAAIGMVFYFYRRVRA